LTFARAGNLYAGGVFTSAGTNITANIAEAALELSSYDMSIKEIAAGKYVVSGLGTPELAYVLERATNLAPPVVWVPVATNVPSTAVLSFTNTSTAPRGFYRTRYAPQ
jgi:hypothetical protein